MFLTTGMMWAINRVSDIIRINSPTTTINQYAGSAPVDAIGIGLTAMLTSLFVVALLYGAYRWRKRRKGQKRKRQKQTKVDRERRKRRNSKANGKNEYDNEANRMQKQSKKPPNGRSSLEEIASEVKAGKQSEEFRSNPKENPKNSLNSNHREKCSSICSLDRSGESIESESSEDEHDSSVKNKKQCIIMKRMRQTLKVLGNIFWCIWYYCFVLPWIQLSKCFACLKMKFKKSTDMPRFNKTPKKIIFLPNYMTNSPRQTIVSLNANNTAGIKLLPLTMKSESINRKSEELFNGHDKQTSQNCLTSVQPPKIRTNFARLNEKENSVETTLAGGSRVKALIKEFSTKLLIEKESEAIDIDIEKSTPEKFVYQHTDSRTKPAKVLEMSRISVTNSMHFPLANDVEHLKKWQQKTFKRPKFPPPPLPLPLKVNQ